MSGGASDKFIAIHHGRETAEITKVEKLHKSYATHRSWEKFRSPLHMRSRCSIGKCRPRKSVGGEEQRFRALARPHWSPSRHRKDNQWPAVGVPSDSDFPSTIAHWGAVGKCRLHKSVGGKGRRPRGSSPLVAQ